MNAINVYGAGVIGIIVGIGIIVVSTLVENYFQDKRLKKRFQNKG